MQTSPTTDPGAHPIADALVVTLCSSVSLEVLRDCGILEREWSIYKRLSARYGRIILVGEGGAADLELAKALPSACPVMVVHNPERLERPAFAARAIARVVDELRGVGSAVIRTDQMWGGELALALTQRLREAGCRVGLIARGGYPWSRFVAWEQGQDSPFAAEAAAEESALCRAADLVVGTSMRMLDDYQWRYGLSPNRTMLIPNFVPESARPDDSITREPGRVLFAGRLSPQKRIDRLIDAVALIHQGAIHQGTIHRAEAFQTQIAMNRGGAFQAPSPHLTIIGEGPLEADLREHAKAKNLEVEFLPRLPQADLLDQMRRCAVYAQVSLYEGHPKTLLEAMACGCPVVVGNGWGLADVVIGGLTGLVTECRVESLAAGIARVLTDPDLAATLGRAAAEAAEELRFNQIIELEATAHETAMARAGEGLAAPPGAVRWGADLLDAQPKAAAEAFARSIQGYARRLPNDRRQLFCAELDTPVYDAIDQTALETSSGIHPKHHLMRYHNFFVERINQGETVLDLGCGYCQVARSIAERAGAFVTGMDFSKDNLDQAHAMIKREGLADRLRVVEGDITRDRAQGPSGEEHFDVVVLSNVLEHLADRERLLALYAEWYTPRAILIRVPAFDRNWLTAWKEELGVDSRSDPTHETEYTEESLREELAAAGLSVQEMIVRWGEYWVQAGGVGVVGSAR